MAYLEQGNELKEAAGIYLVLKALTCYPRDMKRGSACKHELIWPVSASIEMRQLSCSNGVCQRDNASGSFERFLQMV